MPLLLINGLSSDPDILPLLIVKKRRRLKEKRIEKELLSRSRQSAVIACNWATIRDAVLNSLQGMGGQREHVIRVYQTVTLILN